LPITKFKYLETMTQQTSYGVAVAAVDDSHADRLARAQRMMTVGKSLE